MTSEIAVLVVCTGNICRSPFAEQWLRHRFGTHSSLTFASAGTRAEDGERLPVFTERLISERVGPPESHSARVLTRRDVDAADLVLGLSREHRGAAVRLLPRASRKTFALREFARLAEGAGPLSFQRPSGDLHETFAEAVGRIAAFRGAVRPPAEATDDDVPDPYGLDFEAYERSAESMTPALEIVATFLEQGSQTRHRRQ